MKFDFVKVAAATPTIKVGDVCGNARAIKKLAEQLHTRGVEVAVFPELCVTGYTAADLFFTRKLLDDTVVALNALAEELPRGMLTVVGAPIAFRGRLYNCAVGIGDGAVLGLVPKTELPDYCEFYEKRYFTPAFDGVEYVDELGGAPMGNVLFECANDDLLTVGCEICEDMWADVSPSVELARAGATVIANLSASDEVIGKADYRRLLVCGASGRLHSAYIYADAGEGESTTDVVFSGHNIIAENGAVLAESMPFGNGCAVTDIDLGRLDAERRRVGLKPTSRRYVRVNFKIGESNAELDRKIEKFPFVPSGDETEKRAELILTMQSRALASRMRSARAKTAVIGVSGGLDSALALLVCNRAADKKNILPVTMPAFGTTDKTRGNAQNLCDALGLKLTAIDIKRTTDSHLRDIKHDTTDVTYENAQARVRTLTLFDLANKTGGLVVGTGDLSELALGWATYNGDHMSSYGVNAGVPKTLVKYLVEYEAERLGGKAKKALFDILGTDISPELLPPENGVIAQKTEDILGKYDLLDFIMYYYVRYGFTREKIEFLITRAFSDVPRAEIDKALDVFYKRFFAAQFKRSCLPDGVKIGSVSFSPRSDFRLPSDI